MAHERARERSRPTSHVASWRGSRQHPLPRVAPDQSLPVGTPHDGTSRCCPSPSSYCRLGAELAGTSGRGRRHHHRVPGSPPQRRGFVSRHGHEQPVGRQENVSINGSDVLSTRLGHSSDPRKSATVVHPEFDDPYSLACYCDFLYNLRRSVSRTVIHNNNLMLAKLIKIRNCPNRMSNINCFIICYYNETYQPFFGTPAPSANQVAASIRSGPTELLAKRAPRRPGDRWGGMTQRICQTKEFSELFA